MKINFSVDNIKTIIYSSSTTQTNKDIFDGTNTDIKIIAAKYDISENTAKFLIKVRNIESLDYAIEGESSVLSNVSSGKEMPEDIILDNEMKQILKDTLHKLLSERDIYILKLRYGMIDGKEYFDGGLYDNSPSNMLIEKGYYVYATYTGFDFSEKLDIEDIKTLRYLVSLTTTLED